jgi:pimeloyl-ACP methyl ester carboxylesterase
MGMGKASVPAVEYWSSKSWAGGINLGIKEFLFAAILIACLGIPSSGANLRFVEVSTAIRDYARTPVLFVHGYGMDSSIWQTMITRLMSLGYPREYLGAVEIAPNRMANIEAAQAIIKPKAISLLGDARALARRVGFSGEGPLRLDIVSHSMGAVSSRYFAAKLHPELVRTWIALAGANHGTDVLCSRSDDSAKEMCPAFATSLQESVVQVALNGTPSAPVDETPFGLGVDRTGIDSIVPDPARSILYITVRIEPDEWIKPEHSAVLDGAGGVRIEVPPGVPLRETSPGNFLLESGVGHDPLPEHPPIIQFVASLLAARN